MLFKWPKNWPEFLLLLTSNEGIDYSLLIIKVYIVNCWKGTQTMGWKNMVEKIYSI